MNIKELGHKLHWWWLNHRHYFRHKVDTFEQLRIDFQYLEHDEWLKSAWGVDIFFDEDDFNCQVYEALEDGSFWQDSWEPVIKRIN